MNKEILGTFDLGSCIEYSNETINEADSGTYDVVFDPDPCGANTPIILGASLTQDDALEWSAVIQTLTTWEPGLYEIVVTVLKGSNSDVSTSRFKLI